MYSYICGTLADVESDAIVVDNHGIGYRILVPSTITYHLPDIGKEVKIYTYLNVREDAMKLFGFLTKEELAIFKLLIGVNGVGPKGALAILGALNAEDLRFAVLTDNSKAISAAPGIGAKTAQRIIVDLKDKIDVIVTGSASMSVTNQATNQVKNNVIEALISLGYSSTEVMKALSEMEISDDDREDVIIKEVLKKLSFL